MRFATWLLCSLLFAPMAYAADSIGVFTVASGEVRVMRANNYLAAAPGVDVLREDIIETGKDSAAQLDMEDGSVLKLGPDTRVALSDYRLDGDKSVISASLDVLSGWLRFAVKKLKTSGNYKFNTPVMVVGIRGTEGTIEAQNEQGGLDLKEGKVEVSPFGGDAAKFQPVQVNAGEFVERARGRPLAKLKQPPPAFGKRVPPVMHEKLERRAEKLKERNVKPKVIRPVTREDAKRLIDKHPHLKEKLHERFKPIGAPAPNAPGKEPKGKGVPDHGMTKDGAAKEPPRGGFGGQVLHERKLKGGQSNDPNEVAEALRKRYEAKQGPGSKDSPRIERAPFKPAGKLTDEPPKAFEGKKPPAPIAPEPAATQKPGGFAAPTKLVPADKPPGEKPQAEKSEEETKETETPQPPKLRSPTSTITTTPFRPLQK